MDAIRLRLPGKRLFGRPRGHVADEAEDVVVDGRPGRGRGAVGRHDRDVRRYGLRRRLGRCLRELVATARITRALSAGCRRVGCSRLWRQPCARQVGNGIGGARHRGTLERRRREERRRIRGSVLADRFARCQQHVGAARLARERGAQDLVRNLLPADRIRGVEPVEELSGLSGDDRLLLEDAPRGVVLGVIRDGLLGHRQRFLVLACVGERLHLVDGDRRPRRGRRRCIHHFLLAARREPLARRSDRQQRERERPPEPTAQTPREHSFLLNPRRSTTDDRPTGTRRTAREARRLGQSGRWVSAPMMEKTPATGPERALHALLVEAGELALSLPADPTRKEDGTLVTVADRALEEVLVARLRVAFPEDAIEGEEGATVAGTSGARWYVDPIDGTGAFVEGLPMWGPTVARVADERVTLAGFYVPRTRQYFSVSGDRARLDGDDLASPVVPRSPERIVFVPSRLHQDFDLRWGGKARSLGSTAAHLCLTAAGSARAAIVGPGWKPWDVLCGLGMIAATGGATHVFRADGSGGPLDPWRDRGLPFVAGDADSVRWLATPGTIQRKEPVRP